MVGALRRYELERQGDQRFGNLSGGQQARFQILLLELQGATALLLDEPTDNLDLESAEALQEGLESYEGTVLAVTHDRWFARTFDRYEHAMLTDQMADHAVVNMYRHGIINVQRIPDVLNLRTGRSTASGRSCRTPALDL